jgi:hypothetical protein
VEALEDRLLMSVNVLGKLNGMFQQEISSFTGFADPSIAAGPNYLVEATGAGVEFLSKATGKRVYEKSLPDFFLPLKTAGSGLSSTGTYDSPTATYNELLQRYVVVVTDNSFGGVAPITSYLDVAVSKSSDPTAGWIYDKVDIAQGSIFQGYVPKIGWNADAVVVSVTMSPPVTETYVNKVVVLDSSTLTSTDPKTWKVYETTRNDTSIFVPAVMHGSKKGDPMWFAEVGVLGGNEYCGIIQMTNVLSNNPGFTNYFAFTTHSMAAAPARQPGGGAINVQTHVMDVAWRNNELAVAWTGYESDANGSGNTVWWLEVNTQYPQDPVHGTPYHSGEISQPGVDIYNPAIEIAPNGNLGMTYLESSPTQYMTMFVTGMNPSKETDMEPPVPTHYGQAAYSYSAGDYAGISVDPVTGTFWAANTFKPYAPGSYDWGTGIVNFSVS